MIDIHELRVGNTVSFENTPHIITEIHRDIVLHKWIRGGSDGYYTRYDDLEGIKVTADMLLKSGFKQLWLEETKCYVKDYSRNGEDTSRQLIILFWQEGTGWIFAVKNIASGFQIAINNFQYFHELQNLYLDITRLNLIL